MTGIGDAYGIENRNSCSTVVLDKVKRPTNDARRHGNIRPDIERVETFTSEVPNGECSELPDASGSEGFAMEVMTSRAGNAS